MAALVPFPRLPLCALLLMVAIAVLPYAVRNLSGIPTSGVTPSDAAVLALLTAAELLCYAMPFCALGVGAGLSASARSPSHSWSLRSATRLFAQCLQ